MRLRFFIFLAAGSLALVFAKMAYMEATYFTWRTAIPMGKQSDARMPTREESQAFAEKASAQVVYANIWFCIAGMAGVAFGLEACRALVRRRAVEQAVADGNPAAGTPV
jgi:hypothetical protein